MKIQKIVSYVVLAIGLISGVLLYVMNSGISKLMFDNDATDPRDLLVPETAGSMFSAVSPLYNLSVVVIAILLIVTVATIVKGLVSNPSSLKKTAIGVGVFLLIVGVSYALAEGAEVVTRDGEVVTAGTTKWVGAGIITFYICAATAIGAMIAAGVRKSISN